MIRRYKPSMISKILLYHRSSSFAPPDCSKPPPPFPPSLTLFGFPCFTVEHLFPYPDEFLNRSCHWRIQPFGQPHSSRDMLPQSNPSSPEPHDTTTASGRGELTAERNTTVLL